MSLYADSGSLSLVPSTLPKREYINTHTIADSIPQRGWWSPFIGRHVGYMDLSIGAHFWHKALSFNDDSARSLFIVRNLQFRHLHYLAPGYRISTVLRGARRFEHLSPLELYVDEALIENLGYFQHKDHQFSYSLKAGRMRYLRFPYPDLIAMYDQVPDIFDLTETQGSQKHYSGYQGIIFAGEYSWKNFGAHLSQIQWVDHVHQGTQAIERYLFYRKHLFVSFEARLGILANRRQSHSHYLGSGSRGYSLHIGKNVKGFHLGFLYEYLEDEGIRTGILAEFTPNIITKVLGKYRVDYTRSPQGIGIQPTLFERHYGFSSEEYPEDRLVGVIVVERATHYWQNGQGRNVYEHIVFKDGDTNPENAHVVIKEGPTYLRAEALVSRHNDFSSYDKLLQWEKKRQGPAHVAKIVSYHFYKK